MIAIEKKGKKSIEEFFADQPEKLKELTERTKNSGDLKSMGIMNSIRNVLPNKIKEIGVKVYCFDPSFTVENRNKYFNYKDHWIDAACVGEFNNPIINQCEKVLIIDAKGYGSRQMLNNDKFGFPRNEHPKHREKKVKGFQTGDIVALKDGRKGILTTVKTTGQFRVTLLNGEKINISYKKINNIQQHAELQRFIYLGMYCNGKH